MFKTHKLSVTPLFPCPTKNSLPSLPPPSGTNEELGYFEAFELGYFETLGYFEAFE